MLCFLSLKPDINSQVTFVTETFLGYRELRLLIKTIKVRYPDIRIIVADDGQRTEWVGGRNVDQYIMPPAKVGYSLLISLLRF